ncbi:MAG: aromatic ring-hydroxylating dioxygenase subunit alpha [Woeseia sp.]|nr:aromatic ring-hydroxylating dioxygenase subunit alpha [Woeseia sp.]MBT8095771.1 aromatic ring-hydroxylating dioxygenase subunit alpha [Woeseia sp.]NNE61779.1 aromatic ring-hydroxylating dioxygenase subunit alpha [Woeseia sp.]NNL54192.1 aromatic ring-hydroxylating dioxygenase subunit alpha [Woeseia sp.]
MTDPRTISELVSDQRPGWSLEQRLYTDPAIFELEIERIILRNWVLAGHVSELQEAGDFKVVNVANESAIIVRGKSGELLAHANVCRHRGSLVCLAHQGNTRKFECPYHGWMYDLDGSLLAARSMPAEFDKGPFSLHAVALEVLGGLIFICFSDRPPSLAGARADLARPFAMFGFENLKVAAKKSYEFAANWKLAIENYQECYHCASAHPEYARMHTLMLDPAKRSRVQQEMRKRMSDCGLVDLNIDFIDTHARPDEQGYGYSRTALFDGYQTGSRDGRPLAPLLGELTDFDGGASDFTVGPFSFLLAYSDHVVAYVFTPIDATHCKCEIFWLVRDDAEAGEDYDETELTWLWDVTTQADKRIIVNNWRGVQSTYYRPGPFSAMEQMQARYITWLLQQLADDKL